MQPVRASDSDMQLQGTHVAKMERSTRSAKPGSFR